MGLRVGYRRVQVRVTLYDPGVTHDNPYAGPDTSQALQIHFIGAFLSDKGKYMNEDYDLTCDYRTYQSIFAACTQVAESCWSPES